MRFIALVVGVAAGTSWAGGAPPTLADRSELEHRSAFTNYQSFKDEPVGSWREANDKMLRLGGHMGHLSEAMPPERPLARQRDEGSEKKTSAGDKP